MWHDTAHTCLVFADRFGSGLGVGMSYILMIIMVLLCFIGARDGYFPVTNVSEKAVSLENNRIHKKHSLQCKRNRRRERHIRGAMLHLASMRATRAWR
jgi:hypothetical protein